MLEVKEVLRLWLAGVRRRWIAAQLPSWVSTSRRSAGTSGLRTSTGRHDSLGDGVVTHPTMEPFSPSGRPLAPAPREC